MTKDKILSYVQSAMDYTEKITTRWNPRISGTQNCLDAAQDIHKTMNDFCDRSEIHEFSVHPQAFFGFIRVLVVLFFVTLSFLFMQIYSVAFLFSLLSLSVLVLQFFLYKEMLDPFYPKKVGRNIVGIIEPVQEVQKQIVISGHHDSAYVANFMGKNSAWFFPLVGGGVGITIGLVFVSTALFFAYYLGYNIRWLSQIFAYVFLVLSVGVIPLWFFHSKKGSPGAADNMIASAIAMEVGKHYRQEKKEGKGLKHTRLVIASWDAEEAGLRGSRAFIRDYASLLQEAKTYHFNLECLFNVEHFGFTMNDLNSFVKLSHNMVDECIQISHQLGFQAKKIYFPFMGGGTDAAEFAKAGIEATTLASMAFNVEGEESFYHTIHDDIDAVDSQAVEQSIAVAIEYIRRKDLQ